VRVVELSSRIRILLADQHALFREAMRAVLDAEPDIIVVAEARTALEAIGEGERFLPDVVILDLELPMSHGSQTITSIRDRLPATKILALSPREEYRTLVSALDAGAHGFLTREAPLGDLIQATRAVCRGETFVPPTMLGLLLAGLLRRRRDHDEAYERLATLTRREREVLALLAEGADNAVIARTLVISPQTARTHIQNILTKLSVHSRLEAAAFVTRNGIATDLVPVRA
jgi:DNA-binding NarL/FixJ family response regulator